MCRRLPLCDLHSGALLVLPAHHVTRDGLQPAARRGPFVRGGNWRSRRLGRVGGLCRHGPCSASARCQAAGGGSFLRAVVQVVGCLAPAGARLRARSQRARWWSKPCRAGSAVFVRSAALLLWSVAAMERSPRRSVLLLCTRKDGAAWASLCLAGQGAASFLATSCLLSKPGIVLLGRSRREWRDVPRVGGRCEPPPKGAKRPSSLLRPVGALAFEVCRVCSPTGMLPNRKHTGRLVPHDASRSTAPGTLLTPRPAAALGQGPLEGRAL